MSRITAAFQRLRETRRAALIPYLTLGYPHLESALHIVPALVEAGADIIELGVPFSDPLADGATIQAASQQALANGMTPTLALEQVAALRRAGVRVPLVLMGYYNPWLQMGLAALAKRAAAAGVDGFIVPDLPLEEAAPLQQALAPYGLDHILLLAPTADEARIRTVAQHSRGFLYLVSVTGVTGTRAQLPSGLADFIARVRPHTTLPLAVGFGISRPEHAAAVARLAEGVIVGSALLRAIAQAPDRPTQAARDFLRTLRKAMPA